MCKVLGNYEFNHLTIILKAKGLVAKLTHPQAQSAWGFRGKRVRGAKISSIL